MTTRSSERSWLALTWAAALLTLGGIALALPAHTMHGAHYAYGGGALQLVFDGARADALFALWRIPIEGSVETGLTLNRTVLFPGDTVLPLGYGFFYLGLLTLLVRGASGPWSERIARARWLPMAAMVLDLVENQMMDRMLVLGLEGAPVPDGLALASSLTSVAKYGSISVVMPVVGVALVAHLWRAQPRRRARLALYGAALVIPMTFLAQSLSDAVAFSG